MDVELENLIKFIFPANSPLPENWKENPDIASYLSKLGSHGLESLTKEPDRLNEAQTSVLQQTQNVAFANYKTFIHSAECSREIFKHFNDTEHNLDTLITKLPEFMKTCEEFIEASNDINMHRRLNSLTLTRNAELLEILELPQLMDTCIRNGNYEEALELAGYVRRLGKKHGQIPLILTIVNEVEQSWLSMLHTLLSQLRTDLQLPKCLQVVGYLRRMELFSESEIRLKFLQARDSWLQSLLKAIPEEDANHHLSKTIELSRVHLFNIVTQYRAIFSDEDPHVPSSKYMNINECNIFYGWITSRVSMFLSTLEYDLNRGIGTSVDSMLGQCMYFGLSFSRVGADFRGLIAPIFIRTIEATIGDAVRKATKKYELDMDQFSLTKTLPNIVRNNTPSDSDKPPQALLEFYPLAEYYNGIVTALNDLRLCAPIVVGVVATNDIQDSLGSIAKCTLAFYRQEQQALSRPEKDSMARFCAAISEELIPHVQRCIHVIYPPLDIAGRLGVTVQQLKTEGITYLNPEEILDPIAHLLPVKIEPIVLSPTVFAGSESIVRTVAATVAIQDNEPPTQSNEPSSQSNEPSTQSIVSPPLQSEPPTLLTAKLADIEVTSVPVTETDAVNTLLP